MNTRNLLAIATLILIASCSKKDSSTPPPQADKYLNTTAGSTWDYHQTDASGPTPVNSDYTLTSTSHDTTISGRTYHVYSSSASGNQYITISGNDYYQFDSLPAGLGTAVFERLYLKANVNVGTTWNQNLSVTVQGSPIPVPITVTYTIAEKGISRTVGSDNYTNVIHVATSISSTLIPSASLTTAIDSYYAEKYGLIENSTVVHLDYLGITKDVNVKTTLVSATIL